MHAQDLGLLAIAQDLHEQSIVRGDLGLLHPSAESLSAFFGHFGLVAVPLHRDWHTRMTEARLGQLLGIQPGDHLTAKAEVALGHFPPKGHMDGIDRDRGFLGPRLEPSLGFGSHVPPATQERDQQQHRANAEK